MTALRIIVITKSTKMVMVLIIAPVMIVLQFPKNTEFLTITTV